MKCEELLAGLNDVVDGEQATALCQELREHLVQCNPCQIVIDNIRQTITLYNAGQAVALPVELHQRLCNTLRSRWAAKFPQRPAT